MMRPIYGTMQTSTTMPVCHAEWSVTIPSSIFREAEWQIAVQQSCGARETQ